MFQHVRLWMLFRLLLMNSTHDREIPSALLYFFLQFFRLSIFTNLNKLKYVECKYFFITIQEIHHIRIPFKGSAGEYQEWV